MEYKTIILAVIFGAIGGAIASFAVLNLETDTKDDLISEFYAIENAVYVSPHSIRKAMDKRDDSFVVVDLRSQQEYEADHIIGAVSIPAYKDPDTSAYGDVERITNSFKELISKNPRKEIIVYCYSMPCMTGRKIGAMLVKEGIFVKHLGIGWNEWKYYWTLWNHEGEWNVTKPEEYIINGTEPGIPKLKVNSTICPIGNKFGC